MKRGRIALSAEQRGNHTLLILFAMRADISIAMKQRYWCAHKKTQGDINLLLSAQCVAQTTLSAMVNIQRIQSCSQNVKLDFVGLF